MDAFNCDHCSTQGVGTYMELPVHVHVCLGLTEFYFFFKHTQITKIVSQVQINPLNDSSFMQPYEQWIALIKPNEIFVKLLYSNN